MQTGQVGNGSRATAPVRYSLPPDTVVFTGRAAEVEFITGVVAAAATRGGVLSCAIDGMPGLGKTALAIHVAHLLRRQFADRQLFIDLHGHTPGQPPVTPEAALASLLAVTGVDARSLPADLAGRQALWRDRMAGQRALLVLDNAASSQQVAPLLPGDQHCLVLVTSRRHLGDLPGVVVPVMLEALPPGEAAEMFRRLAPRTARDPAAAAVPQLVRLAGFLPLAISLLARVYLRHPSWTIADLIRETEVSLLTLTAEAGSIAAAFGVSYRTLTTRLQDFFRILGLHPGTTIDAYAAAALAGLPVPAAAQQLDALHGEGLLTEPCCRRYGMHDLIRAYSRHCTAEAPLSGSEQSLDQLLDYYQHTAILAETCLARQTRSQPVRAALAPVTAPDLADRVQALAWLRAERVNLLACLDHATRAERPARVVAFTSALAALLRQDGPWGSAITHHQAAVRAAQQLGDRLSEASALIELGTVLQLTGAVTGAATVLEQALDLYRDLGDPLGQANALNELGAVLCVTCDFPGSGAALGEALSLYRRLGDRLGEANTLNHLGAVRRDTGDYQAAAVALLDAVRIHRDLGNQSGRGAALVHLGTLRRLTGDLPGAEEALTEGLGVVRGLAQRSGEVEILNELGALHRVKGSVAEAVRCHRAALQVAQEIDCAWDEAHAVAGLARCDLAAGQRADGEARLRQAHEMFQRIGAAETPGLAAELAAVAGGGVG
jgi:tetratricopeptide (TPR) repeat protein